MLAVAVSAARFYSFKHIAGYTRYVGVCPSEWIELLVIIVSFFSRIGIVTLTKVCSMKSLMLMLCEYKTKSAFPSR